jgi:5-aminopentanamidase
MRVTAFELAAAWGDPLARLAQIAPRLVDTDLALLPEQALSGYVSPDGDFDCARFAEPLDGPVGTACAQLARRRAFHLVAPLVLREGDAIYNAMACWGPDGAPVFVYRKRHPWFPELWATPGPSPAPVVELRGARVTIAICYDMHFLDDELAPADLLLFPSAWVEDPDERAARLQLVAQRHGVAIANANWGSGVVRVAGQGKSCVVRADGTVTVGTRVDLDV